MIILNHTHEKEFAFRQALAPDYFVYLIIVPEEHKLGECMFVYMMP